jgi:hypothetical protein
MSILEELNSLLAPVLPVETGIFSGKAPDRYAVLTPLTDTFDLYSDNKPHIDICEVRISLFSKGNYTALKKQVTKLLLEADFTVTGRYFAGHEDDTGYYHYCIDAAKEYETED